MQARSWVSGFVALVMLTGCSSIFDREVDYKAGAVKATPLEVPPNMTVPETEQRYTIPGKDGEQVASYSEYTKQKVEQPCVSPESAPSTANTAVEKPTARLRVSKGVKSILLGEPFDRSWRRVGLALDLARLVTTDKDRSKGIYFIAAAPDKEKKKQPDYQVVVRKSGAGSKVTVVDQNGKNDAETTRLVEVIYQSLNKNAGSNGSSSPR